MSSINLLPKDFKSNNIRNKKETNKFVFLVSVLLVIITGISFGWLYFLNKNHLKEIENLNQEVKIAEEEIEKSFLDTKLILANSDVDDAVFLLSERVYFTKIINAFQNNLMANIYFNSLNINFDEDGFLTSEFNGVAKDYYSLISQIYFFKSNDVFEGIDIKSAKINESNGYIDFGGSLKFKRDTFFY